MSASVEFELHPLRFDNLLAFMALLGLLRALETARPEWRVRAFWRRHGGRGPWVPVLRVEAGDADRDALVGAALDGMRRLAPMVAAAAGRLSERRAGPPVDPAADVDPFAAAGLAGETVIRDRRRGRPPAVRLELRVTPFLPKPAAGQQNFLRRLGTLDGEPNDQDPLRRQLHECLFEAWRPRPSPLALRWDPSELRPYALRWRNPADEPAETVEAAVRLAALALPWFPLHPRSTEVAVPGFLETKPRDVRLRWPIWDSPARPAAVRALLSHPALVDPSPDATVLRRHGVVEVVESRVVWLGDPPNDYPNFTRGRPLWGVGAQAAA